MRRFTRMVFAVALVAAAGLSIDAQGREPVEQVEITEVNRLTMAGGRVEHIDGARQAGPGDLFAEAIALPENDAGKFHISVFTMRGCAPCAKLKQDWARSPDLQSLAKPHDAKTSWAHYHEYQREDASQSWRLESFKIQAFPTIVVQSPRNNRYGAAGTVVYQDAYRGDASGTATAIIKAVRDYCAKIERASEQTENIVEGDGVEQCPFDPPPKEDPFDASPVAPNADPFKIPPDAAPAFDLMKLLAPLFGGLGGGSLQWVLIAAAAFIAYRKGYLGNVLAWLNATPKKTARARRSKR